MKKLFLFAVVSLITLTASAQRFSVAPNGNNTGTALNYDMKLPAYAPVMTFKPSAFETTIIPTVLTSANTTVVANVGDSKKCDQLTYIFRGASALTTPTSALPSYTITFSSTGHSAAAVLTCDSNKTATARFVFDGIKYRQLSALKN